MSVAHKSVRCGIENCRDEGTRWIPVGKDTLHLCVEHLLDLTRQEDEPTEIEILTEGKVNAVEVGFYSCSEGCSVCN